MRPTFIAVLALFFVQPLFAQQLQETIFSNEIQEVTLFLSGAQVFEKAQGSVTAGESVILIKGLSPYLD